MNTVRECAPCKADRSNSACQQLCLTLTPHCLATAHSKSQLTYCLAALAEDGEDTLARALKRPRLVWTPKLHQRFVEAVEQLGLKVAVPKTIMQVGALSFASSVLTSRRGRVEMSFSVLFRRTLHGNAHAHVQKQQRSAHRRMYAYDECCG